MIHDFAVVFIQLSFLFFWLHENRIELVPMLDNKLRHLPITRLKYECDDDPMKSRRW